MAEDQVKLVCFSCGDGTRANEIDPNIQEAKLAENKRIINLLLELKAIRYCSATGKLVGFNTDGDKVIYLNGMEIINV